MSGLSNQDDPMRHFNPNRKPAPAPPWLYALYEKFKARGDYGPVTNGHGRNEENGDGTAILEGSRNATLTSMAGTMRKRGFSEEAIRTALLVENEARCEPPLDEEDVATIARSVARYEPDGMAGATINLGKSNERTNADNSDDPLDQDATAFDLMLANSTIRWAWESWLQIGVLTILASEPGCGKTRFCADLARRVALGLPWPDGTGPHFPAGSKTLWVPADNQHPELGSLPQAFGFLPNLLYLNATKRNPFTGTMLDQQEDLNEFEARIRRVQPAIVFVDTCLNATDRTSHKPEDAKAFFKPLQQIAQRCQTVLVCVTHLNAAGKPLGRRIEGQGRVVLMLEDPDPDGAPKRRKLWVKKSNSPMPAPLGVTMGDGGNEYDLNPPQRPNVDGMQVLRIERGNKAVEWLRGYLKSGPKRVSYTRSAAEMAGFSSKTLYAAKEAAGVYEFEAERYKYWELPVEPLDEN